MNSRNAFTLIEIVLVVAIIALLASIVMFSIKGVRENARINAIHHFAQSVHNAVGADLAGMWRFEEGSGTTAQDFSGNRHDGTLIGQTSYVPNSVLGGNALRFDGNGDYVNLPSFYPYDKTATYAAWVMMEGSSDTGGIFGHDMNQATYISMNPCGGIYAYFNQLRGSVYDGQTAGLGTGTLRANEWYYVVFVKNIESEHIFLYVDGGLIGSGNFNLAGFRASSGPYCNNNKMSIGMVNNAMWDKYLLGQVDEAAIYEKALTAGEINALYANSLSRFKIVEK